MSSLVCRRATAAVAIVGMLFATPSQSYAFFHGGCHGCGGGTTAYRPYTAMYAPAYTAYYPAAPACGSCNTCSPCAQTCNYMPQTCYRTVYQQVPVTAYQPVAACDACGQQTTAYRPVTTYMTQARLVPYTTYRPVYAAPAPCATGCAPAATGCATGNCASASMTYATPVSTVSTSSPSCCSSSPTAATATPTYATPSYSTPTYTAPSQSYPSQPTYQSQPAITQGTPGSTVPSLAPTPAPAGSSVPRTFNDEGSVTQPESRLRPIPDPALQESTNEPSNKKTNSTLQPRLLDLQDRTTARPMPRTATVIPVSVESQEDDGWRPARH